MTGGEVKAAVCPMTMSANTGDYNDDDFDVNELLMMMILLLIMILQ